jgi:C1A family cysteine protease
MQSMYALAIAVAVAIQSVTAELPIVNPKFTSMFDDFKVQHNKNYESESVHDKKYLNFISNVEYIMEHNAAFAMGKVSYEVAINHLADLNTEEYSEFLLTSFSAESMNLDNVREHTRPVLRSDDEDSFDWRDHGAVSPVKNQGQCGSCWSFSAVGAMEGAHYLSTGELVSLSEQQLLDCVLDGQFTCSTGGLMDEAFKYVIKNKGIVTEEDKFYKGRQGKCDIKRDYNPYGKYAATFSSYAFVTANDEEALLSAVKQQPVAIAIDASHIGFQFYHRGVYDPLWGCCKNCNMRQLDHGVLLVGYGTKNKDYWLVKNSWGPRWGSKGYIKMVRNKQAKCGVGAYAIYPIV